MPEVLSSHVRCLSYLRRDKKFKCVLEQYVRVYVRACVRTCVCVCASVVTTSVKSISTCQVITKIHVELH